jgi:hypothetical protein
MDDNEAGATALAHTLTLKDCAVSPERMREHAEALWGMLDDISTAGDAFKPNLDDPFVRFVLRKCEEKNAHFQSDGYKLYVNN